MRQTFLRVASSGFLAMMLIATLPVPTAFAEAREINGDFSGKTMCQNGLKKAGFKDPLTQSVTYYSLNEISHYEQALGWPQADNPMSFDEREKRKNEMHHVLKILRALSCDTQDSPAQSTGLNSGAQNPTQNGVKSNGYVK